MEMPDVQELLHNRHARARESSPELLARTMMSRCTRVAHAHHTAHGEVECEHDRRLKSHEVHGVLLVPSVDALAGASACKHPARGGRSARDGAQGRAWTRG